MEVRPCLITLIDLHHTAGHEANTAAVRQEHLNQGWGDIGYNVVVEPNGTVGKGRDTYYSGAHNPGLAPDGSGFTMNQRSYAISHIGNFHGVDADIMTDTQLMASVRHCVDKCKELKIMPSRQTIRMHKDDYATNCPGDHFPYNKYLAEVIKLYEGGEESMEVAVVYFSSADYSEALIVANENGGCATFCRNSKPEVHKDAMNAKKVFNIGGPRLGHANEVYLSGQSAKDTLKAVAAVL